MLILGQDTSERMFSFLGASRWCCFGACKFHKFMNIRAELNKISTFVEDQFVQGLGRKLSTENLFHPNRTVVVVTAEKALQS